MLDVNLDSLFSYHAPSKQQKERYEGIRSEALQFARTIRGKCPQSAERSLAIRHLQQVVMWANASIAINEAPTSE